MFNRSPDTPSSLQEEKNMFAEISTAVKQAERAMKGRTSNCQNLKKIDEDPQSGNKAHVRKKQKQLNPFLLEVGHEVLRQKKPGGKNGHFHSESFGPCIIDHVSNHGHAILRDAAGSRLKRPIKISHLKQYMRGSHKIKWFLILWAAEGYYFITEQCKSEAISASLQKPHDVF